MGVSIVSRDKHKLVMTFTVEISMDEFKDEWRSSQEGAEPSEKIRWKDIEAMLDDQDKLDELFEETIEASSIISEILYNAERIED